MSELDPFVDPDEDADEEDAPTQDNSTIAAIRKAEKAATRRAAALEKEVEELRAFRSTVVTERRDQAVALTFEKVGLNPQHAKLYKALNPEVEVEAITAESVAAFASEYALLNATGEPVSAPEAAAPQGFTPVITGTPAPAKTYSLAEAEALMNSGEEGRAEADAAFAAGRVERLPRDSEGRLQIDWLNPDA